MRLRIAKLALAAKAALSLAPPTRAQECVLGAIAAGPEMPTVVHALHLGILSLLIPVVLLFLGILLLILLRARRESISS